VILEFLDDKWPETPLLPRDQAGRAAECLRI
jgi:glutathione S-transferase